MSLGSGLRRKVPYKRLKLPDIEELRHLSKTSYFPGLKLWPTVADYLCGAQTCCVHVGRTNEHKQRVIYCRLGVGNGPEAAEYIESKEHRRRHWLRELGLET